MVMGLLFTKLWSFFGDQEHKVIVVGLDNAGKTTILYQFLMNEVVHTSPTIGSNVEEIMVKSTHFLMWDIGGQDSLRSSWNTYYTNTEFIILVVDSTDRERLSITKEELYRMLAHEDLRNAAVLIFANKQDKKCCMSAVEISKFLTLSAIKDHPWHIQACCALTGEGLCQGLEWMTTRVGSQARGSHESAVSNLSPYSMMTCKPWSHQQKHHRLHQSEDWGQTGLC
ncbi:ADP-ribosylation factor-like protein 5B isoform X5 [Cetorhinus maximus]